jgi:hypothetical protein
MHNVRHAAAERGKCCKFKERENGSIVNIIMTNAHLKVGIKGVTGSNEFETVCIAERPLCMCPKAM